MGEKKDKIPNYEVTLEDWHEGVFATSLVQEPAIESDFVYFDKDTDKNGIFKFGNEEKREVVGAVLVPDKLIPRRDPNTGDVFTVSFSKEVIVALNERMKEYGYDNSFTFHHAYSAQGNVQVLESWIKEFDDDKSNGYGFDLPIGTLFFKVKIKEDNLWEMIKENKLNGFSVELNAGYKKENNNEKEEKMSKKELFNNSLEVNDSLLLFDGDDISADTVLFSLTVNEDESEKVDKFSGEFEFDGKRFNVEKGVVSFSEIEKEEKKEDAEKEESFNLDEFKQEVISGVKELIDGFKSEINDTFKGVNENFEEIKLLQKQKDLVKVEDKQELEIEGIAFSAKESAEWLNNRIKGKQTKKEK